MTTFLHSGNTGDLIYAIPAIKALSKNKKPKLFIKLDVPANYSPVRGNHPLGRVMFNKDMFDWTKSFFLEQNIEVDIWHKEIKFDYNLDLFRQISFDFGTGFLPNYYHYRWPESWSDLTKPCLTIKPNLDYKDRIVLHRTTGYLAPGMHLSPLIGKKAVFIGVEQEYAKWAAQVDDLEYKRCSSLLEFAEIISGCKIFIGNASIGSAIAWGLQKQPRLLEVCQFAANVRAMGPNAYEFISIEGLKYYLNKCLGKN